MEGIQARTGMGISVLCGKHSYRSGIDGISLGCRLVELRGLKRCLRVLEKKCYAYMTVLQSSNIKDLSKALNCDGIRSIEARKAAHRGVAAGKVSDFFTKTTRRH